MQLFLSPQSLTLPLGLEGRSKMPLVSVYINDLSCDVIFIHVHLMSDSIHKLFSIMNSLSIKIIEMIESFVLIPRFPSIVEQTYFE